MGKSSGVRNTQSRRAGLVFPVARFTKKLRTMPQSTRRVSKTAGVYTSAAIEYLMAEILELAGNVANDNKHRRITPRHLMIAIRNDTEIDKLLQKVVIPSAGTLPQLGPLVAMPAKRTYPPAAPAAIAPRAKAAAVAKPNNLKKAGSLKKGSKNVTVLSERILPSGIKLTVVQADITDVAVDAIVHPTNNAFYLGGEVGSAISKVGGKKVRDLVQELHRSHGNLAICGAAMSGASDTMQCKNIIHVYSPHWDINQQAERIDDLKRTVDNVFAIAESNGLSTIALPSISSGGNGFPKQVAAQTILRAINAHFKSLSAGSTSKAAKGSNMKQVYFVLYDPESVAIYTSELGKLEI